MRVRELVKVLQELSPDGEMEVDCTYSKEGEPVRSYKLSSVEEIGHQGETPMLTIFLDDYGPGEFEEDEDEDDEEE